MKVVMVSKDDMSNYDFLIKAIGVGMRSKANVKLVEFDITNPQARLLGVLHHWNTEGREISRKALQETFKISGPSITSLLNALERKNFIQKASNLEDGRRTGIKVTTRGLNLIDEMEDVFEDIRKHFMKGLTEKEQRTFYNLLLKIYKNVTI